MCALQHTCDETISVVAALPLLYAISCEPVLLICVYGNINPIIPAARAPYSEASLGRWEEALRDYNEATDMFQVMRNLSGAIYARSNAALTLAELGRDEEAIKEMEAVSRRAAGSIDMRAALAAMHW